MELFIIHCTTCQVRLKVQDESVIGEILSCPKCGSMVHVVPPTSWARSAGPQTELAESVIQPPPSEISKPLPAKVKAASVAPPLSVRRAPVQPSGVTATRAQVSAGQQSPAMAAPVASVASRISSEATPSAAVSIVTATIARLKQDWMLYSGGLAVGVMLGVAGLWLAASTLKPAPQVIVSENRGALEAVAQAAPALPQSDPAAVLRQETLALKPSTAEEPGDRRPEAVLGAADEATEPTANDPSNETSVAIQTPLRDAAASQGAVAPANPGAPALKLDPAPPSTVAHHPALADPTTVSPTAADRATDGEQPAKIGPMTADPPSAVAPGAEATRGALSASEIEERLASELSSVQFVEVPLAQFVEFIGDLARLQIRIDDRALESVGKRRASLLTVKLTKTTAGQALAAGLESLGLTCVARNGKLVVTARKKP